MKLIILIKKIKLYVLSYINTFITSIKWRKFFFFFFDINIRVHFILSSYLSDIVKLAVNRNQISNCIFFLISKIKIIKKCEMIIN